MERWELAKVRRVEQKKWGSGKSVGSPTNEGVPYQQNFAVVGRPKARTLSPDTDLCCKGSTVV